MLQNTTLLYDMIMASVTTPESDAHNSIVPLGSYRIST